MAKLPDLIGDNQLLGNCQAIATTFLYSVKPIASQQLAY